MKRVPVETIRRHLFDGYGMQDYYDLLIKQNAYMLLGDWRNVSAEAVYPYGESDLPSWPDIPPREVSEEHSRRILRGVDIAHARMMGGLPLPNWEDIDDVTREFRQEAFQRRYRQQKMQADVEDGFKEGYSLGVGAIQHGFMDWENGTQIVDVEHIKANCIAFDPLVNDPRKSDWVAICRWMDMDEAAATYPSARVDKGRATTLITPQMTRSMDVVRVIEYFHRGNAAFEPTYAIFVGPLNGYGPVKHESNPWGKRIPITFYVYKTFGMMQRPVGVVWMQVASQTKINEAEDYVLDTFRNGRRGEVLNPDKIDPKDWEAWRDGKQRFMRTQQGVDDVRIAYQVIPEKPIEATVMQVLQYWDDRHAEESGLSDLDRGSPLSGGRSATEISVLDQRTQANMAGDVQSATLFLTDFVDDMSYGMKIGDTAPCNVEFDGETYTINGPDEDDPTMAEVFEADCLVKVDQDSLTTQQSRQQKQIRAQSVLTMVQAFAGILPPDALIVLAESAMKNMGLEREWSEIEDTIRQQTEQAAMMPQMAQGALPGAPMPQMPSQGMPGAIPGAPPTISPA